jgi:hypothetical protein
VMLPTRQPARRRAFRAASSLANEPRNDARSLLWKRQGGARDDVRDGVTTGDLRADIGDPEHGATVGIRCALLDRVVLTTPSGAKQSPGREWNDTRSFERLPNRLLCRLNRLLHRRTRRAGLDMQGAAGAAGIDREPRPANNRRSLG